MLSYRNLLFMLGVCTLIGIAREWVMREEKKDEMLVAGHRVDKASCTGSMNELFGNGLDSVKTCEFIIPAFYELIKADTTNMQKILRTLKSIKNWNVGK